MAEKEGLETFITKKSITTMFTIVTIIFGGLFAYVKADINEAKTKSSKNEVSIAGIEATMKAISETLVRLEGNDSKIVTILLEIKK